jgi:hypothetical protein
VIKLLEINVNAINKMEGVDTKEWLKRTLHISLNNSIDSKMNVMSILNHLTWGIMGLLSLKIDEDLSNWYEHAKKF